MLAMVDFLPCVGISATPRPEDDFVVAVELGHEVAELQELLGALEFDHDSLDVDLGDVLRWCGGNGRVARAEGRRTGVPAAVGLQRLMQAVVGEGVHGIAVIPVLVSAAIEDVVSAYSWMLDNWIFVITNFFMLLAAIAGQAIMVRNNRRDAAPQR